MANPQEARSESRQEARRHPSERSDDIDWQRVRQWVEYVRSNPPGPFAYWRPVIVACLVVCAIFASLVAIDLAS